MSAAERAFADGWAAHRAGAYGKAAEAFERAYLLDRNGPIAEDACYWWAKSLLDDGDERARTAFLRFMKEFPDSPRVRHLGDELP